MISNNNSSSTLTMLEIPDEDLFNNLKSFNNDFIKSSRALNSNRDFKEPPGQPELNEGSRKKKKSPERFIYVVIFLFVFLYASYGGFLIIPSLYRGQTILESTSSVVFHVVYILAIISYVKCVVSDPGRIPYLWAFYRGDRHKRRRYCKQCNAWKPDRTHHCSVCARCVLNMDHHCPWIHNCVGFYNRKFFLQLLIYSVIGLAFILTHSVLHLVISLFNRLPLPFLLYDLTTEDVVTSTFTLVLIGVSGLLFLALLQFSIFHLKLVLSNSTTIENLDSGLTMRGAYDLGALSNCRQVFGPSVLLWWLPHHTRSSAPIGDGVRWNMQQLLQQQQHEEPQ